MPCCGSGCCAGVREVFDAKVAEGDLRKYRRRGPNRTTRLLRDGILALGGGESLIDIGGGVGALSSELLANGFRRSTLVDASPAYLGAAKRNVAERGLTERMELREGDFVEHAAQLAPADAVVMDRVVCCYPEYRPLLEAAASHSRHLFAYAYPHDRWYVRMGIAGENLFQSLRGGAFRAFVHPERAMSAILAAHGFRRASRRTTFIWCADVYVREKQ